MGSATAKSSGSWLKTVQPPSRITVQHLVQVVPAAAMGPMMDSVVKSVPRPTTTPAKAKSMAGVKSAPPNRWMAFIMM